MTRVELRWATGWALVVMLITCLPYLYVASLAPPGTTFSGLLHSAADHCVYLSWEQQAAQGHFFMRNLFTGDPQQGIYVSLLSWIVGIAARLSGLPLILVDHGARVLSGALLLILAYRLSTFFTSDQSTRRAAFWFTALSAGFGWLYHKAPSDLTGPVDGWQPEANTFLCLYTTGLFCVALSLMLGVLILLLAAEGEKGWGRWGRVMGAGVLGLLLGNIHSYDIITLAGVWGAYRVTRALVERRFPGGALVDSLAAALVALPSTLYQYYLYRTDTVFRARAGTETLSPPLLDYLLGYGLILLLAVVGGIWLIRTARHDRRPLGRSLLPLTWAVVGFAIPYLPFTFQRKLIQGQHLPLAFLAAVAAVALARRIPARLKNTSSLTHLARRALVAALVCLTTPTLWLFVQRDIEVATEPSSDPSQRHTFYFVPREELAAMRWARENLPEDGVVFCSRAAGSLFPALAGRTVYVGHWSETPDFDRRLAETTIYYRAARASTEGRHAFLQARNIRYVYYGTTERQIGPVDPAYDPFMHPIYQNAGVALYEFCPTTTARRASPAGTKAF